MKCPVCDKGTIKKGKIKEYLFGVYLGEFPAEICSNCKESFTDSETTKKIQEEAKKKGLWGLDKRSKVTRSGNSLAIRIPKETAKYLRLEEGKEVYIHPENNKLVIES